MQSPKATPEKKNEMKREMCEKIQNSNKIYSLDETGIYLVNHPYMGWEKRGKRCIYKQQKNISPRCVSLIMMISEKGVESYKVFTQREYTEEDHCHRQ